MTITNLMLLYWMNRVNLKGKRYGRWTVLEYTGIPTRSMWRCKCDCGRIKDHVLYTALTGGGSTSCGCSRFKEPDPRDKLRAIWSSMKTRCYNSNHRSYKDYGARGITVCDEWRNSFKSFCRDMHPRPSMDHSVERRNNDGPYCRENCYWATRKEQSINKRRTKWYEWKGQMMVLPHIARLENVAYCSLRNRIFLRGLSLEDAVAYCKNRGLIFDTKSRNRYA